MFERSIVTHEGLEVRISDHVNQGIIDILNHAVQGSEGGLRFQLRNIDSRIAAYNDQIRFVSLYRKNRVVGTVGSCFRMTGQGKLRYPSSYIRYLAFQTTYQSEPGWKGKKKMMIKAEKDDSFRQRTLEIFSKPHMLGYKRTAETERHIMYAFVESMNERSKNLVTQAGYEYIRSFLTVAFSRFSPKPDSRVTKLVTDAEKRKMEAILLDYYKEHSFFSPDYAFYGDRYYVLKEGDEIIAGVNAIPSVYTIHNMPGVWGWVIMKVLPSAPYFKRLFHPQEFRHLVFDAVYCKKGREEELAHLLNRPAPGRVTLPVLPGSTTGVTFMISSGRR